MWFRRLDIQDLRNLEAIQLELSPGINHFYGDNGAGKTAILEAVHVLARGRSFRTHRIGELIRQGTASVRIHAAVEDEQRGDQQLVLVKSRGDRTELRINGVAGRKLSQAAALLPLQVMVPSLSDLVFGPPAVRRQWLDWGAFHVKPLYFDVLRAFLHTLRQRNAALKAVAAGELNQSALAAWSSELARLAESVARERGEYLDALAPVLEDVLRDLSPRLEISLVHQRGWPADQAMLKLLSDWLPKEVKSGSTRYGPHRADVELRAAGLAAGAMLSRGQGKTLASALMLSQARLLMRTAHRSSVFLIDDIGAELDSGHGRRFFELLKALDVQVLATSNARPEGWPQAAEGRFRMFHVEHGEVTMEA